MSKKLFVASLPFDYTSDQLKALFAAEGTVEAAEMVPDRKSGKTRGFGFVTMTDDAQAQAAIEKLNGTALGERKIWVTEARPRENAPETSAAPRPNRFQGPNRFNNRRPFGDRGPRERSFGRRDRRPPSLEGDQQPKGFDSLFSGTPPTSEPRRPFGRSGRSVSAGYPPYNPSSAAPGDRGRFQRGRPEGGRGPRRFSGPPGFGAGPSAGRPPRGPGGFGGRSFRGPGAPRRSFGGGGGQGGPARRGFSGGRPRGGPRPPSGA